LFAVVAAVFVVIFLLLAVASAVGVVYESIGAVLSVAGKLLGIGQDKETPEEQDARLQTAHDRDARDVAIVRAGNQQDLEQIGFLRVQAAKDRIKSERRKKQRSPVKPST
jgi:hypothetical protein